MGKRWQSKRKNEHFYKKAKREGYRSRASYKLLQLGDKYELIEPGDVVLDLGAAPGGWLQVVGERIGEKGFGLGVDLEPIEELDYENVKTIQADITEPETKKLIQENLPGPPDLVISDASPAISGIWDVDHARSIEIARAALDISVDLLQPGGSVLVKVFQGEFLSELREDFRNRFDFFKATKPDASRKESAEIYLVGKGFSKE